MLTINVEIIPRTNGCTYLEDIGNHSCWSCPHTRCSLDTCDLRSHQCWSRSHDLWTQRCNRTCSRARAGQWPRHMTHCCGKDGRHKRHTSETPRTHHTSAAAWSKGVSSKVLLFSIVYYVLMTSTYILKVYCLPICLQLLLRSSENNACNLRDSTCNSFKC